MADMYEGRSDSAQRLNADHLPHAGPALAEPTGVKNSAATTQGMHTAMGDVADAPAPADDEMDRDDSDEGQGEHPTLEAPLAGTPAHSGSFDLAELASLSDVALPQIDPEDMPLVVGGGVAGIAVIALAAGGGGGGGGGGEAPVPPLLNVFDLLADNPDATAGPIAINGTDGQTDLARFEFQTVMDQARSAGSGQVFNINGFDAAEGDRIQFVQTDNGMLNQSQFIDLVDPVANGFADITTFNFLNAAGGLSAQLVVEGAFTPPADSNDPFFNVIDVV